ncbi:MAG: tandem-95 repeat protein, partial [Verrucomicrobia bacterium]|nr:tandem-95 repeat protein [Verrucomicrobiota bacterium]
QLDALNPNGDWKLYLQDTSPGESGVVAGGWTVSVRTAKVVCCGDGQTSPTIAQNNEGHAAGATGALLLPKNQPDFDSLKIRTGLERVAPSFRNITVEEDNIFQSVATADIPSGKVKVAASALPGYTTTGDVPAFIRIADLETAAADLVVTATSGNENLIKSSNIKLTRDGTGVAGSDSVRKFADYKVDFRPEDNAFGTTTVTITVTDGSGRSGSAVFNLTVNSVNDLPTFASFPRNQALNVGTASPALPFTVSDIETAAINLIVTAETANAAVIPNQNISLSVDSVDPGKRTISVIPASSSESGSATINVALRDAPGATPTLNTIVFDFSTVAGKPTISPFGAETTDEDTAKTLGFTLRSGSSTPVDNLALSASIVSSSVSGLIPASNVTFGGSGTERTITVRPAADLSGTTTIRITAADGTVTNTRDVAITVSEVNDPPTISTIATQTISEDTASAEIAFTIGDKETAVAEFTAPVTDPQTTGSKKITVASSVPTIIPATFRASGSTAAGIIIGGSGADRTIKLTPAANAFGRTIITISVEDGGRTGDSGDRKVTTSAFSVFVNGVNDPPTIGISGGAELALEVTTAHGTAADGTAEGGDTADQSVSTDILNASDNATNPPVAMTINEDGGNAANPNGRFVDGDPAKDVVKHWLRLKNMTPGNEQGSPANVTAETDQQVTITATTDSPNLIKDLKITDNSTNLDDDDANTSFVRISSRQDRGFRFVPVRNAYGTAIVTLTLTDNGVGGVNTTVRKFKIVIRPKNDAPSLDAISNIGLAPADAVSSNQALQVPINLSDLETSKANMSFSASVSTQAGEATVDSANVTVDPTRTRLAIVPIAAKVGTARITVTFTDRGANDAAAAGDQINPLQAQRIFDIRFDNIAPNNPPSFTLSTTPATDPVAISIDEDTVATANVTAITDEARTTDGVTMSGQSSNQSLVKDENILFGGSKTDAARTLAIVPEANANGNVTISILATDKFGLSSTPKTIALSIRQVQDAPTITLNTAGSGDATTKWSSPGGISTFTAREDDNPVQDPRTSSKRIEVNVSDPETATDSLTVTAISKVDTDGDVDPNAADSAVVPPGNITISSTGSTRTLTIVPAANRSGTAGIRVTVRDGNAQETRVTFNMVVESVNDEPTISQPSNLTIDEDYNNNQLVSIGLTGINAGGSETDGNILIAAKVVDKGTNPDDNTNNLMEQLSVDDLSNDAGSGYKGSPSKSITDPAVPATATLKFRPIPGKYGQSTIFVRVRDSAGTARDGDEEKTVTFDVTVREINDKPTISEIADQTVPQDGEKGPLAFVVQDDSRETDASLLTISASSDNPGLIPNTSSNLQLTGSGPNRGVIVRPAKGASGTANVTVTVSDKGKSDGSGVESASRTFRVTVVAGQNPIISTISAQTLNANAFSDLIEFTVTDAQTPAANITVRGESLNTSVIPAQNLQFGPVDSTNPTRRSLIIKTETTPGNADIRLTARDADGNETSVTFTITVKGEPPTISAIPEQTIAKGGSTGSIPFTVADKETFPGFLRVTARSSNQVFVPNSNVVVGGSGSSRTITVTAAANQEGSATITVSVTDNESQTTTRDFVVKTPDPRNDAPTVTSIANQSTDVGVPTQVLSFSIGDDQTAVGSLVVTATSSNKTLVPDANVFLGGSGATRTVFVQPAAGLDGTTTITVTVTDNGPGAPKSASTSFTVTVSANEKPTISAISSQTTERNRPTSSISFSVGDKETAVGSLTVAGASSDANIVASSGIALGGSGASRTVVVTPVANAVGNATITLTVTDGGGKTASTSFTVTITQPPAVKGDFDGDGQSDLLFQDNDGFLATWLMSGTTLSSAGFTLPSNVGDAAFRVVTSGDFNRDGSDDIIFQHTDGTLAIWFMSGTLQNSAALINPSNPGDSRWRVVGSADLNRDGKLDLVFQHGDGTLAVWYMDGTSLSSAALLSPASPGDAKWKVVGVGDLTGDGREDLVFQYSDGTLALWAMNGTTLTTASLLSPSNPGAGWRVAGTGKISKAFTATLTGAAERPAPVNTTATGSGKLTIVGNQLSFNITYSGLSGVATGAHIHLPATTEQTAGVSINFQAFNGGAFGTSGSLVGSVTLTADQLAAIVGGQAYVNVHTAANGGGEIRGQIVADTAAASKVDLLFQSATRDLAVWFMDGTKLSSAQLLTPSNSGGTWTLVAPK